MPDFDFKGQFPIGGYLDSIQKKALAEEEQKRNQQAQFIGSLTAASQGFANVLEKRRQTAEALAQAQTLSANPYFQQVLTGQEPIEDRPVAEVAGRPVALSQTASGDMNGTATPTIKKFSTQQIASLLSNPKGLETILKAKENIDKYNEVVDNIVVQNPDGTQTIQQVPRSRFGKTYIKNNKQGSGAGGSSIQQTQFVDNDGTPLVFNKATGAYQRAPVQQGVSPVSKKGDESSIADATLLSNQLPNVKLMFDAYRKSSNPRLQSTAAGRVMNPAGKQSENALKLAAFSFGGKNLTGQEKEVVFGALFPSWTDDDEARNAKEKLLTDFISQKIDLLQAANLLGPAGQKMRTMLEAKMKQPGSKSSAKASNADLTSMSDEELQRIAEGK